LLNRLTHRTLVPPAARSARVALVTIVFDDDAGTLERVAEHADGLVIAAFGVGHVPEALVPALERLASDKAVVLASRTGAGAVLESTYAFPGSERDLLGRGLIGAGFLDPLKSRILLHELLCAGVDRDAIIAAFRAGD